MKKYLFLIVLMLSACAAPVEPSKISELKLVTAPIIDPLKMTEALEILKPALIEEYAVEGIEIESVSIDVLTSHNATGEALSSGSAHIGLIGATTYVEYKDEGVEALLAATRAKVSKDSMNPSDWNNQVPTTRDPNTLTSSINAIIVAGPSEKGKAISDNVNRNESIPWEMLSNAQWCISACTTSSIAYIYPNLWLYENYGKLFKDLSVAPLQGTFSDAMVSLALNECDVAVGYSFILSDYEKAWNEDFKRTENIFKEVNVIGVTRAIQNDIVAVSSENKDVDDAFKLATQNVFKRLVKREDMATAFKVFNILGYQDASDEFYVDTEVAYNFVKEKMNE